jgi:hypothetical protein
VHKYHGLLATRINPYFPEMPLKNVTLSEIKAWRTSLNPKTEATNAAAYRLLRSLLQAAEEEELIDPAPPKIRGAGSAPVRSVAVPATLEEIAVITDTMPERLWLGGLNDQQATACVISTNEGPHTSHPLRRRAH